MLTKKNVLIYRYSCTASLGRERRTASTVVTILPATSGHSGVNLQEQVNDMVLLGEVVMTIIMVLLKEIMIIIRKHFWSLKKSCWSQGEGSEAAEVEGSEPLR